MVATSVLHVKFQYSTQIVPLHCPFFPSGSFMTTSFKMYNNNNNNIYKAVKLINTSELQFLFYFNF